MPDILRHFLLELYEIIIQNVLKVKEKLDSTIIVDFILFSVIMSVSEWEQALLVHRERRMAIMIAAYAASSTKGANHNIMTAERIFLSLYFT